MQPPSLLPWGDLQLMAPSQCPEKEVRAAGGNPRASAAPSSSWEALKGLRHYCQHIDFFLLLYEKLIYCSCKEFAMYLHTCNWLEYLRRDREASHGALPRARVCSCGCRGGDHSGRAEVEEPAHCCAAAQIQKLRVFLFPPTTNLQRAQIVIKLI